MEKSCYRNSSGSLQPLSTLHQGDLQSGSSVEGVLSLPPPDSHRKLPGR